MKDYLLEPGGLSQNGYAVFVFLWETMKNKETPTIFPTLADPHPETLTKSFGYHLKLFGAPERLGHFWAATATLSRKGQRGNIVAGSSTTWPNPL